MTLLDLDNLAHVCELFKRLMYAFFVYSPCGELGGEGYEGFGAGGFCNNYSLKSDR